MPARKKPRTKADFKARAKAVKAWKNSVEGQSFQAIAVAVFRRKLEQGMPRDFARGQSEWSPLSPDYKAQKAREGRDGGIWRRTGKTEKAVSQAPEKFGTRRGLLFGVNQNNLEVFVRPTTVGKGGRKKKAQALSRVAFGSRRQKLRGEKIRRRLLAWFRQDVRAMAGDVARTLQRELEKNGLGRKG